MVGNIHVPETAKRAPVKGRILAVGPGTTENPMDVKKGDIILHLQEAGMPIELKKKKLLIMRSMDIVAIDD